jgi:hypothetical protein
MEHHHQARAVEEMRWAVSIEHGADVQRQTARASAPCRSRQHRSPDEDDAPLGFGFAEATSSNRTRRIVSAIDLTDWLDDLPREDRHMLELRAAGLTLEETAEKMGVSISNIFTRCKRLGFALAEHAGICIQPKKRKARGSSRSAATPKSSRVPRQPTVKKAGARNTPRGAMPRAREMTVAA